MVGNRPMFKGRSTRHFRKLVAALTTAMVRPLEGNCRTFYHGASEPSRLSPELRACQQSTCGAAKMDCDTNEVVTILCFTRTWGSHRRRHGQRRPRFY